MRLGMFLDEAHQEFSHPSGSTANDNIGWHGLLLCKKVGARHAVPLRCHHGSLILTQSNGTLSALLSASPDCLRPSIPRAVEVRAHIYPLTRAPFSPEWG